MVSYHIYWSKQRENVVKTNATFSNYFTNVAILDIDVDVLASLIMGWRRELRDPN
jgi:hypothetical protein